MSLHTRRDVLRLAALASAATAPPSFTFAADEPRKKIPIGLELYSVRKELPKDFTGIIEAVGKMGYAGRRVCRLSRLGQEAHRAPQAAR